MWRFLRRMDEKFEWALLSRRASLFVIALAVITLVIALTAVVDTIR